MPEIEIMKALSSEAENHRDREKIEWDSVEQSPRHINELIARANEKNVDVALPDSMSEQLEGKDSLAYRLVKNHYKIV